MTKKLNVNSVCQNQNVKCGKIQKGNHLHSRACGTINISKYVNNVLSTNPTTGMII